MPKMDSKPKHVSWFGNMCQKFETICYEVDNIVNQVVPGDSVPSRDQTCHPPGDSVTHVSRTESGSAPVELGNVSADNDSAANSAEEVDMKSKSLESEPIGLNSATQKESFEGFFSSKPLNCDSENRDACHKPNCMETLVHGQQLPLEKGASENGNAIPNQKELNINSSAMEVLEVSTSDKVDLSEASFCTERISSGSENTSGSVDEYSAETSCHEEGLQSFQVAGIVDGSPLNDSNHINDRATAAPLSEPGISVSTSNKKFDEIGSLSSKILGFTGLHSLSEKSDNSVLSSGPSGHSIGYCCGIDNVNDSEMETIDLYDKLKLEDRCAIVDDKILHDVSRRTRKLRSFKQKIQDLFAPKKLLIKDYETLSIWYGDSDIESSKQTQMSPSNILGDKQAQQMHDSGWELL